MTTYQVKCPCGTTLAVTPETAGEQFVCPRCARKLAFSPPKYKPAAIHAGRGPEEKPTRWFLARNKQRLGPYSSSQLKQLADAGNIIPADMILKEGRQKWVNAGSVRGLFTGAAPPPAPPPELPVVEATPLPEGAAEPLGAFAFSTTPGAAYARRPSGSKHLWLIGGGAALAVVALATVIVLVLNRGNGQQTTDGGVNRFPNAC